MISALLAMQMTALKYMIANNVNDLTTSLEKASNGLFEWFKNNLSKSNADKCHLLVSINDRVSMNVDWFKLDKSDIEKLLVVQFDYKLTFDDHTSDICKKTGRKISALARVTPYIGIAKKRIFMNAFSLRSLVTVLQFGCAIVVQITTK